MFGVRLLDFESELAQNGLELMAKDMRTQPTSQNSIPKSQILDFGSCLIVFFCTSHVSKPKTMFLEFYLINL